MGPIDEVQKLGAKMIDKSHALRKRSSYFNKCLNKRNISPIDHIVMKILFMRDKQSKKLLKEIKELDSRITDIRLQHPFHFDIDK